MDNRQLFKVLGSYQETVGADWRSELHTLLNEKPRRLSRWCELGLFGAMKALQDNRALFTHQVAIRVNTHYGCLNATLDGLVQSETFPPMPFTFMQTQPGQLFNALGRLLGWQGDGMVLSSSESDEALNVCSMLQALPDSTLLGWLDDQTLLTSRWFWLERKSLESAPLALNSKSWSAVDTTLNVPLKTQWLYVDYKQQLFGL